MVGGFAGLRIPFLGFAAGALQATFGGCDLDRCDAGEVADFPRDLDAGDDGGLGVDDGGIGLDGAAVQAEFPAGAAEGFDVDLGRTRDLLDEAGAAFEDRGGAGHAGACEAGCEDRVAAGFSDGDALPQRQRADARLRHGNVVVEGESDRVRKLAGVELHQFAGGECDGGQAEDRRVPAARRDVEHVDEAAVDLVGDDDREDEVAGGRPLGFGDGEAGRDVVAGVDRELGRVGVVEVEVAERGGVGEGGEFGGRLTRRADDGGGAFNAKRDGAANADGFGVERAEAAADGIDDERLHALDRGRVEVFIAEAVGVGGEAVCEGWRCVGNVGGGHVENFPFADAST